MGDSTSQWQTVHLPHEGARPLAAEPLRVSLLEWVILRVPWPWLIHRCARCSATTRVCAKLGVEPLHVSLPRVLGSAGAAFDHMRMPATASTHMRCFSVHIEHLESILSN